MSILLARAYDEALEKYDVIVMPTLPYKAPKLPDKSFTLTGIMTLSLRSWLHYNSVGFNPNIKVVGK